MTIYDSIILGIIEGFTEFLPISSTGHLIVASEFLGINQTSVNKAYEVIIQFVITSYSIHYTKLYELIVTIAIFGWLLKLYSDIRFDIENIVNYNPPKTTQFFDKNGNLIANIFENA